MKIIDTISALGQLEGGWVLTIGNFDGVHSGHQQIIARGRQIAAERSLPGLAVMTFEPHPAAVVHPYRAPAILTPPAVKKGLLADYGADCLIVMEGNRELLNLSPADFVDRFIVKGVRPKVIVEGPNFNFGYGRSGDVNALAEFGGRLGFDVEVVMASQMQLDDESTTMCSSSLVRRLLHEGKVASAGRVLGRHYRLVGRTMPGRGIGTELGFPTANMNPLDQVIPAEGVYAGFVEWGEAMDDVCSTKAKKNAAFSIGRAKTFMKDHPLLVEAHVLADGVEDLRDKWLAMDFVKKIRPQQRFETHEHLKVQIEEDCQKAREILAAEAGH